MIQTLKISDIVMRWRDALSGNQDVLDFCLLKYGKKPKVWVGINRKNPPTEKDCPLIILRPGVKIEGEDQQDFIYSISVGWAIVNSTVQVEANVIEFPGIYECDYLGQLILEALAGVNQSYPISTLDYEIETIEFFPQFVGEMILEISITPAIGAKLIY